MALSTTDHADAAVRWRADTLSSLRDSNIDAIPDFPSSTMIDPTASASNASAFGHQSSVHQRQKRARSQLSCTPCRQGKLKCNRQHDPACDQCLKRNRESACVYLPPPMRHKPVQNVKGRIRQLENLVVDLMNQNQQAQRNETAQAKKRSDGGSNGEGSSQLNGVPFSQPTPPSDADDKPEYVQQKQRKHRSPSSDVDAATKPFGQMRISKDEIRYVGEAHWGAILNSISELRRDLEDDEAEDLEDEDSPPSPEQAFPRMHDGVFLPELPRSTDSGIGFIVGSAAPTSKEQIIKSMPEKKVVDRLLSLWFNSPDPFKPIIHAPTFQAEYKQFWRSPKDTPAMWLGLLFTIMSLAASFGLRGVDPASGQAQQVMAETTKYHSLAASAAVLADFTKPKQYTLECLIFYAAGLRSKNSFVDVWLMIGLVVRLALRMGYHRDPDHYPAISPFQGEMRRRCWATINMIDVLISFQLGLPSMVKTIQSDSQPPRNILDRDFHPSTKVLPPSRSPNELTPSSYTRAKLKIILVFAEATELSHATIPPSYEHILSLDRKLEEAKAAVPPLLQMPEISELVTDTAEQLMCRFNLDLLYLKTKLVLHRKHMLTPYDQLSPAEQERGIGDSRKCCAESALRVLRHHHTIYTASQTGGQLESVKWYMGSISTHDFLLAAMIICLELSSQIGDTQFASHPNTGSGYPKRRELIEALDKSHKIWASASQRKQQTMTFAGSVDPLTDELSQGRQMFDETDKASHAMAVMVEKVKRQFGAQAGDTPQQYRNFSPAVMAGASTDVSVSPQNGSVSGPDGTIFSFSEHNQRLDFMGLVSNYDWTNLEGIDPSQLPPEMLRPGDLVDNGLAAMSGNVVPSDNTMSFDNGDRPHDSSPRKSANIPLHTDQHEQQQNQHRYQRERQQQQQQQQQQQAQQAEQQTQSGYTPQDFTMTSEMLELPAFNFDWRGWDQEIINSAQPPPPGGPIGGVGNGEASHFGPGRPGDPSPCSNYSNNINNINNNDNHTHSHINAAADGLLEVASRFGNIVAGGTGPGPGVPNVFAPGPMDFGDLEMGDGGAGGLGFWYGD